MILGTVVASIVFALIVAVLFAPVATRLRGRGWSRTKTAGAVTLLAILMIGLIVILLAVAVVPLVPGIVEAIQSGLTRLQADANASGQAGQLGDALGQARSNAEAWIGGQLASVASWLATAVTVTILGSILTFFLLQDGDKAWAWALQATGDRRREVIMSSGDAALSGVGVWLRGTATQAAIDAVTVFVFLSVLGVPAALALSILAFFTGFIPYLGGLLADDRPARRDLCLRRPRRRRRHLRRGHPGPRPPDLRRRPEGLPRSGPDAAARRAHRPPDRGGDGRVRRACCWPSRPSPSGTPSPVPSSTSSVWT